MVIPWQRANIQAAASYLRERISKGDDDRRTKAIYEGLLEVLDPTRRATRVQREMAAAAKAAVTVQEARDRRALADRRRHEDDPRRGNRRMTWCDFFMISRRGCET